MATISRSKVGRRCALLIALLASGASWAQSDDRSQPITVEADFAERDVAADTMIYRGNVVIRQGSLLIEANQVELFNRDGELQQIVSTGQLARYTQRAANASQPIIAEAEQIDYQPGNNTMTLLRNATLSRDGTLLKGERIDYDFTSQSWQASGTSDDAASGDPARRIQLVIPASDGGALPTNEERP